MKREISVHYELARQTHMTHTIFKAWKQQQRDLHVDESPEDRRRTELHVAYEWRHDTVLLIINDEEVIRELEQRWHELTLKWMACFGVKMEGVFK